MKDIQQKQLAALQNHGALEYFSEAYKDFCLTPQKHRKAHPFLQLCAIKGKIRFLEDLIKHRNSSKHARKTPNINFKKLNGGLNKITIIRRKK